MMIPIRAKLILDEFVTSRLELIKHSQFVPNFVGAVQRSKRYEGNVIERI